MTDKILAVVGTGYWGKNLVRNFSDLGVLYGVCDQHRECAQAMAERHSCHALSWEEVLANSEITSVAIAAPAALHYKLAEQALMAGKHVFVEKPLALKVDNARQLCALAKAQKKTVMVGHLLQYHPVFQKVRAMVELGELGCLQYVYSNRLNFGKIRREEDILWSFAPHDISMILSLVGEEPATVEAIGSFTLHESIADSTTTHLKFPSGIGAHVFVSWLHPFKEQKLVVIGDQGMVVFDDSKPWSEKLALYRHQVDWHEGMPIPNKSDVEYVTVEEHEPLRCECQHFIDCMANDLQPLTCAAEGLRVLSVLERAANQLEKSRTPVSTPPEHSFVHDTACIDARTTIGANTKIWHFSHVLSDVAIGSDCVIGQNVSIGPAVTIGNACKIQNNVSVYKGVTLEDGVFCGPSCVFTNVMNPRAEIEKKQEFLPTHVARGVTIGANATIICGTTIGRYALIGAGAVVTKDVPAHALMVGNPARQVGWVSHYGERLGDDLKCPKEGRRYQLNNSGELIVCADDSEVESACTVAESPGC